MAAKKTGISTDLLIHPGETISDLITDRNISQKELAQRLGVSEAFLSDVINGKKDISKTLAKGLEYVFGVSSTFWLNLQANYDSELLSLEEENTVKEEEKETLKELSGVVSNLKKRGLISNKSSKIQTIIELRKYLGVSNLVSLASICPSGAFRMSQKANINQYVLGAWLCLCKKQISSRKIDSVFKMENVERLITSLKEAMLSPNRDFEKSLYDLFSQYGIAFSIIRNFRGAPVQGYISRKEDGTYQMVLTIRGASADIFWFSLFHELGHIVNGDISRSGTFIDTSYDRTREEAADRFARDSLIDSDAYEMFVSNGSFTFASISDFSKKQNIPPYIVIGRLQKEELIPWSRFQDKKPKLKWVA